MWQCGKGGGLGEVGRSLKRVDWSVTAGAEKLEKKKAKKAGLIVSVQKAL